MYEARAGAGTPVAVAVGSGGCVAATGVVVGGTSVGVGASGGAEQAARARHTTRAALANRPWPNIGRILNQIPHPPGGVMTSQGCFGRCAASRCCTACQFGVFWLRNIQSWAGFLHAYSETGSGHQGRLHPGGGMQPQLSITAVLTAILATLIMDFGNLLGLRTGGILLP